MSGKLEIDKFVKAIAARLPEKVEHIRNDKTFILGSELKLTGVKEFNGEPIQDDLAYEIEVPVYAGKFETEYQKRDDGTAYPIHTPTIKRADHEQELRRAYLAKGLPGIYSYLKPYLSEESLQRVKDTFMKAAK